MAARKAPPIRETLIVRACLDYLAAKRILAWRQNSGAVQGEHNGKKRFIRFNGAKGMADICAVHQGRFIAIEVKRPGGKVTEDQREFLASVERAGGRGLVVHSVDELAELIEERKATA